MSCSKFALLESYWQIAKLIVKDEQQGKARADYGKATLKNLFRQLTLEFGKGFDEQNLSIDDNPTISSLVCSEKDETIVKCSTLNDKNHLLANKYLLYLPKEELKTIIETDRLRFELNKS